MRKYSDIFTREQLQKWAWPDYLTCYSIKEKVVMQVFIWDIMVPRHSGLQITEPVMQYHVPFHLKTFVINLLWNYIKL